MFHVCAGLSIPRAIALLRLDIQQIFLRGGSPRAGGLQAARRVGGNNAESLRCTVQGTLQLTTRYWEEKRVSYSGS